MDRAMLLGLAKDWAIAFVMAAVVMLAWQVFEPTPVSEGTAPSLTLASTTGDTFDLHAGSAPAYVVNFWATWCGPCRKEIPEISAFAAAHPEIEVVGVSVDDKLTTERLGGEAKRLGITYRVVHDMSGDVARAWGVDVFPTTFVLDAQHKVIATRVGEIDRSRLEMMIPAGGGKAQPAELFPAF
jgi:thiol-disulfide isomerase/thioredoxin